MQTLAKAASMADDRQIVPVLRIPRLLVNQTVWGKTPQNHLFLLVVIAESMVMLCQIAGH